MRVLGNYSVLLEFAGDKQLALLIVDVAKVAQDEESDHIAQDVEQGHEDVDRVGEASIRVTLTFNILIQNVIVVSGAAVVIAIVFNDNVVEENEEAACAKQA